METAKGRLKKGCLVSRLLRAPTVADVQSAKTLTSLSTSARLRYFKRLAAKPDDWLAAGEDTTTAYWRRLILAAADHHGLISSFADFHGKAPKIAEVGALTPARRREFLIWVEVRHCGSCGQGPEAPKSGHSDVA
jgi:hypothetical protein